MTNNSIDPQARTLKRIILLLTIIVLINPVVLFLVSESLIISTITLFLVIVFFFFITERKKYKPISILIFNFILVLSFFLHVEAIFTFNFSDYIIDDLYEVKDKHYFNKPYLYKTFYDKESTIQYKTNKQGFRIGAEDEPEIEVFQADWLFLGDSYTQGAQVQYEDLYTTKLFNFFPDKIIINAGISGFGLPDEYYYFINEGKKLNPSKVFLQICNFNDFMNVVERKSGFSDYFMSYSNFARFILYGFKYANPPELPLGRWAEPFYPDEKSNEDYNVFYKKSSEKKKQDLKNFERYLSKLNVAVKKIGAELVLIQIPTKEQVYYHYFEEVISGYNIDVSKLDMYFPNKLLDSLCSAICVKHIDLLQTFYDSEHELFYRFDEHLNVLGHQQMAKGISDFLLSEGAKKSGSVILSSLNSGDRYPNFSPSVSNLLSFQSFKDGNFELFLGDSLIQYTQRLTCNSIDELHPWLSPDNEQIVFTEGNQAENRTKVVMMNINGSERRYITKDKSTFGAIPSFSSDGTRIAYAEWRYDDTKSFFTNSYITVYNILSNEKNIITSESVESWRPIFSPCNEKLFFISKEINDQFDVFEYTFSSKTKRNLTNTKWDEWDPAVSRTGEHLVYASKKDGNWDLFLYEIESGFILQLTESSGNEWDPTFSLCSKYLYYAGSFGFRNGIFRRKLN
ncbi:MAG: hypothetical protein U1C51_02535 [Candidatus Izemoplasmatales bacterium]|nr:hypothetical protein [Candidatus Izemoplasmatales bacterium]